MNFSFRKQKKEEPPRRRAASQRLEEESLKFRRSATLTGSLSDEVRAGAEDRSQLQTARLEAQQKRKKQRRVMRKLGLLIIAVLALIFILSNRVTNYTVTFDQHPLRLPNTDPYIKTARSFNASSMGNAFSFNLNGTKLSQYMMARHKEIAKVTVEQRLFSASPKLSITLRQPVLIWQTTRDNHAFYVDGSGTSFSFNVYGKDEQLVHVNDESGVPTELGAPVASSRQISFLGQLVAQVSASSGGKYTVTKIVFPSSSTKEIDVYLAGRNYFIKVYLERSAKAQGDELVRGVQGLEQRGIVPGEYMDVRIAERVFYK